MHAMKTALTALTLGVLLAVGTAQADGPVSDVATSSANVVFAGSNTATAVITPVTGLMAGNIANRTVLANAVFTAGAGDVAYRWTPGSGKEIDQNTIRLVGTHGAWLRIIAVDDSNTPTDCSTNPGWCVPVTAGTRTLNVSLAKLYTSNVSPDTYPVSMDAVVWTR